MLEKDPSWLHLLPFVLHTGQSQQLSVQRIVEAVIIAGITAGVVMYAGQQVLTERLDGFKSTLQSVSERVDAVDRKVERKIDQLRSDLYVPATRK